MTLIICKDCQKELSPHARTCPNCGRPQVAKGEKYIIRFVQALVILVIAISLLSNFFPVTTEYKTDNLTNAQLELRNCFSKNLMKYIDVVSDQKQGKLSFLMPPNNCRSQQQEMVRACVNAGKYTDDCEAEVIMLWAAVNSVE